MNIFTSKKERQTLHTVEGIVGGLLVGGGRTAVNYAGNSPKDLFIESMKNSAYYGVMGGLTSSMQNDAKSGYAETTSKGALVGTLMGATWKAGQIIYDEMKKTQSGDPSTIAKRIAVQTLKSAIDGAMMGTVVGATGESVRILNKESLKIGV